MQLLKNVHCLGLRGDSASTSTVDPVCSVLPPQCQMHLAVQGSTTYSSTYLDNHSHDHSNSNVDFIFLLKETSLTAGSTSFTWISSSMPLTASSKTVQLQLCLVLLPRGYIQETFVKT